MFNLTELKRKRLQRSDSEELHEELLLHSCVYLGKIKSLFLWRVSEKNQNHYSLSMYASSLREKYLRTKSSFSVEIENCIFHSTLGQEQKCRLSSIFLFSFSCTASEHSAHGHACPTRISLTGVYSENSSFYLHVLLWY